MQGTYDTGTVIWYYDSDEIQVDRITRLIIRPDTLAFEVQPQGADRYTVRLNRTSEQDSYCGSEVVGEGQPSTYRAAVNEITATMARIGGDWAGDGSGTFEIEARKK